MNRLLLVTISMFVLLAGAVLPTQAYSINMSVGPTNPSPMMVGTGPVQ